MVPYLLEAVREGLQLYGRRAPWEDPAHFICQTYPWMGDTIHGGQEALLRLVTHSGILGGCYIKYQDNTVLPYYNGKLYLIYVLM